MGIESNIFDEPVVIHGVEDGYHDFNVLTTSAHSVLYRASKRGKYFIVKTTKDNSERQRQMLSREYELSKGCSHPHIVNTITLESDLAVGEGIVMEYIEGRTLQQFLDEKPTKSELNRVYGELLSAIDYIHKRGIVHNDLKPSNILITYTDNSLKLIDFGLADSDAEFVMQRLGCTSQYASPELIAREKSIDARSDIYSIGVIMSEMFGSSSIARRCMSVDVERRYANIAVLRRAIERARRVKWSIIAIIIALVIVVPVVIIGTNQPATTKHEARVESSGGDSRLVKEGEVYNKENILQDTTTHEVSIESNIGDDSRLVVEFEEGFHDIYSGIATSISREVYWEFACVHIQPLWGRGAALRDSLIKICKDEGVKPQISTSYDRLVLKYYDDLMNQASQLPAYSMSSMPNEEMEFYLSLIKQHRPYEPYKGE